MGHEGGQPAEDEAENPVPDNQEDSILKIAQFFFSSSSSPVLHEDVAEGAVEHGVDQVGEAEVEDQQVRHRPHLVVAWGSLS